jgi:hypothetical protein
MRIIIIGIILPTICHLFLYFYRFNLNVREGEIFYFPIIGMVLSE